MSKSYDPLRFVPSPDVVRRKLHETLTLAERLRLLLELAERYRLPLTTANDLTRGQAERKAVFGE